MMAMQRESKPEIEQSEFIRERRQFAVLLFGDFLDRRNYFGPY